MPPSRWPRCEISFHMLIKKFQVWNHCMCLATIVGRSPSNWLSFKMNFVRLQERFSALSSLKGKGMAANPGFGRPPLAISPISVKPPMIESHPSSASQPSMGVPEDKPRRPFLASCWFDHLPGEGAQHMLGTSTMEGSRTGSRQWSALSRWSNNLSQ